MIPEMIGKAQICIDEDMGLRLYQVNTTNTIVIA